MLRFIAWLFGTFFLLVLLVAGGLYVGYQNFMGHGPSTAETTLIVPRGARLETIGAQLAAARVIDSAQLFVIGVLADQRLRGARPLKAGEYAFAAGISPHDVMQQMMDGRTVQRRLTIPEGLTVSEI